jgi:hypothetical protein
MVKSRLPDLILLIFGCFVESATPKAETDAETSGRRFGVGLTGQRASRSAGKAGKTA